MMMAVFLGLVLMFLGASCFKSNSSSQPVTTSQVKIKDFKFNPQTVEISQGTVVTWQNQDLVEHQIQSDGDLADLLSGVIDQNGTFSFTFDKTGTWKYHCNLHPEMKGTVVVR